jgi:putative ABC transport system ATP-binding protein
MLIPTLTALENVEVSLYFSRSTRDRKYCAEALGKVGLGERMRHLPRQLSGGEQQRVAIARALVTSPKVLFADEPTGNLDTKASQEIFDLFRELNKTDGFTLIVSTHNPHLGALADRIVHLRDGQIIPQEESSMYALLSHLQTPVSSSI